MSITTGSRVQIHSRDEYSPSAFHGCTGTVRRVDEGIEFGYVVRIDECDTWPLRFPNVPFPAHMLSAI